MMFRIIVIAFALIGSVPPTIDAAESASNPAKKLKKLIAKAEDEGRSRALADEFMKLAKEHVKDPVAVDALVWVVTNMRRGNQGADALGILVKNHIKSEKLAPICARIARKPSIPSENALRSMIAKNPHKSVQAQASFHLAAYLKEKIRLSKSLNGNPESQKRFEQYYGKEVTKQISSLDEKSVIKELERLYERIAKSFPKVKVKDVEMGVTAKKELFAIRFLSVGRKAPEIIGEDGAGKPMKLSQFRGKVVLVSFWGHW